MSIGHGRHDSDPWILREIIKIYRNEWLVVDQARKSKDKETIEAAVAEHGNWPEIIFGPMTVASDCHHTVIMILKSDDAQEQHVSKRFFNLMQWSFDRLYPIMDESDIDALEDRAKYLQEEYGLVRTQ